MSETVSRAELARRALKLAGHYRPTKAYKLVRYSVAGGPRVGYTITAQITRRYAHHLTGRVHSRILGRGATFDAALDKAVDFVTRRIQRSKAA